MCDAGINRSDHLADFVSVMTKTIQSCYGRNLNARRYRSIGMKELSNMADQVGFEYEQRVLWVALPNGMC
jgi:hypothetical protein